MTDYFICFHFGDRKYIKRLENRVLVLIFATKNLKKMQFYSLLVYMFTLFWNINPLTLIYYVCKNQNEFKII